MQSDLAVPDLVISSEHFNIDPLENNDIAPCSHPCIFTSGMRSTSFQVKSSAFTNMHLSATTGKEESHQVIFGQGQAPGRHSQVWPTGYNHPQNTSCTELADLTGYVGAIVPVATGRMRNDWYPRRKADYMTDAHLRNSRLRDVPAERDFNFRPDLRGANPEPDVPDIGSVIDMQSQLLAVFPQLILYLVVIY